MDFLLEPAIARAWFIIQPTMTNMVCPRHVVATAVFVMAAACSDGGKGSGGAGGAGTGGSGGSAGATATGGGPGAGGTVGGSASGGAAATGGSSAVAPNASGGTTVGGGAGGASAGGTGGGAFPSGGTFGSAGTTSLGGVTGAGGAPSPVDAAQASGDAAGSGDGAATGTDGAVASACTRELLESTVDAYFKALAAHSAAGLPLAANAKFTENGKVLKVGEEGLWKTAGVLKYAHSALDPEGCNTASEAVVPDGNTDIPFALRLKLRDQQITEIETIAVRAGDYKLNGGNFSSDTNAIIQSAAGLKWEEPIALGQRNTREELVAWMDKYFRVFPRGVCNTTSACKRLENGGGSFSCSAGASCDPGQPNPASKPAVESHIIFADVETGVGVGFALFMGNADMHMFKMYGGQVHAVHAILGAATSTGWE